MSNFDLTCRTIVPELMDQPDLDVTQHHRALTGLERINIWSRSIAMLWPKVRYQIATAVKDLLDDPKVLEAAIAAGHGFVDRYADKLSEMTTQLIDALDLNSKASE